MVCRVLIELGQIEVTHIRRHDQKVLFDEITLICIFDRFPEYGDVWTWGSGDFGQLGQGVTGPLKHPRIVLLGKDIAQV